ncbi:hypothetical protein D9613_005820 [Agrocybe pediades]|uniref:Uncharacterized protein n=1 Tax=Agrocybe pediades TaxID=84607 RepID=A0A8H4QVD0_9AGAR|nr:hypothetical protein D9613_005820 [Agrocybe pediades]KAF9568730.1 hypothetical protein CPC08DRAFT_757403 [Agrocybe pediades]
MFSSSSLFLKTAFAFLVLSGLVSASTHIDSRRSRHQTRQTGTVPEANVVSCDFLLQPTATVDASATEDLGYEFQTIITGALQGSSESQVSSVSSNFTANNDENNTFNVQNQLGALEASAADSKALIEGWVGTVLPGFSSNWIVFSATCK